MKTKQKQTWALPLVILTSCLLFLTCEKASAVIEHGQDSTPTELKKKGKCPGGSVDVRGVGNTKKEAEADLEKKALITCYNICRNNICDEGACAFKKAKVGKLTKGTTANGLVEVRATVECDCSCEGCKGKKGVAQNAFTGSGETKDDAIAEAEKAAVAYCETLECPRFPCDDEEQCLFKKAKTSKAETDNDEGIWTASVELLSCDCTCEEGEAPPDGTN